MKIATWFVHGFHQVFGKIISRDYPGMSVELFGIRVVRRTPVPVPCQKVSGAREMSDHSVDESAIVEISRCGLGIMRSILRKSEGLFDLAVYQNPLSNPNPLAEG